jgi:hypothetical protein
MTYDYKHLEKIKCVLVSNLVTFAYCGSSVERDSEVTHIHGPHENQLSSSKVKAHRVKGDIIAENERVTSGSCIFFGP